MITEDSLFTFNVQKEFSIQKSNDSLTRFFVEKGNTQIHFIKRPEVPHIPMWTHLSFVFWVFVVIFVLHSYTRRFSQIFSATFSIKQVKFLQREGDLLKQSFPIMLLLLYAFVLSFFAYIVINQYYPNSFYFSLGEGLLILWGTIILFYLGKFLSIWFLSILFETRQLSARYMLDSYLFHISEGLILLPLLILFIYSGIQIFHYVAIIVLIALWALRLQRAYVIGLACTNFSRSYLFLYLCTLEVLPFFLLYKLGLEFV